MQTASGRDGPLASSGTSISWTYWEGFTPDQRAAELAWIDPSLPAFGMP